MLFVNVIGAIGVAKTSLQVVFAIVAGSVKLTVLFRRFEITNHYCPIKD